MNYNEEIEELFYIRAYNFKKIIMIILSIIMFIMFMNYKYNFIFNDIDSIRRILMVIIGFSLIVLTISSNAYSVNKFFTYLAITFFLVAFDSLGSLLFIQKIISTNNTIYCWVENSNIIVEGVVTAMLYSIVDLTEYSYNKINAERKYWIIIGITALMIDFFIKMEIDFITGNVIFFIVMILINFVTIQHFRKYDITHEYKVNYMKVFLCLHIGVLIISGIIFIYPNSVVLDSIETTLSITRFMLLFACMISKLLYSPYKILFNDLYVENEELNELNLQVIMKNKELEISQKLLKDRETIFKKLFKDGPIPMIIVNGKNNRIIFANPEFLKTINNASLRDIINRNFFDIVILDDNIDKSDIRFIEKNIYYNGRIYAGGQVVYLRFRGAKVSNDINEYIINFNDVSDVKNNELMKEKIEQKKIEEKMRSDFLSNISHDLKTPVNVIYSASQLNKLYMKNQDMESLRKYNVISKQNCLTLIRLTNNLIDSSRISSDYLKPQLSKNNIVEGVESVVMYLADYAKVKEVDLIFDTEEEDIIVNSDPEFMERIILNLLSNALKYTSKDGHIWVNIKLNGENVLVIVEDDGMGMDTKFLKNAFARYAIGTNNKEVTEKGTGIGLYVVKNLVEMQNGRISIESEVNKGTKIILEFIREN